MPRNSLSEAPKSTARGLGRRRSYDGVPSGRARRLTREPFHQRDGTSAKSREVRKPEKWCVSVREMARGSRGRSRESTSSCFGLSNAKPVQSSAPGPKAVGKSITRAAAGGAHQQFVCEMSVFGARSRHAPRAAVGCDDLLLRANRSRYSKPIGCCAPSSLDK